MSRPGTSDAAGLKGALHHAHRIAEAVRAVGGRALIVGGWVRDRIMALGQHADNVSKDIDIEVFGVPADRLRLLLEAFGRVETVGESFQVYKSGDIDVSLPRRESKSGPGHRGFDIAGDPSMELHEAVRRRDFTINAIAWDPLTEEYLDPCDGRGDIERRLLRVVDPATFGDDSLRVLRAIQFAARFELTLDETTRALCRDTPLNDLPPHVVTVQRVNIEPVEKCQRGRDALLFVIHRSNPAINDSGCRRLAEIVTDGAQHDGDLLRSIEVVDAAPRLIDHLQRVDPYVALGMPFGLLGAP